jgi:hypothetical protein
MTMLRGMPFRSRTLLPTLPTLCVTALFDLLGQMHQLAYENNALYFPASGLVGKCLYSRISSLSSGYVCGFYPVPSQESVRKSVTLGRGWSTQSISPVSGVTQRDTIRECHVTLADMWHGLVLVTEHTGDIKEKSSEIEVYNPVWDEWSDWLTAPKVTLNSHQMSSVTISGFMFNVKSVISIRVNTWLSVFSNWH